MSQTISRFPIAGLPARPSRLARFRQAIVAAYREAATRRALSTLDDQALKDLGLSRAQAGFASEYPLFGTVPENLR